MERSIFQELDEEVRDKQKQEAGSLATFVWIGSGIYLYATTTGTSFISLTALGFFAVGMFVSALVLGWGIYLTQRSAAFVLRKSLGVPSRRKGMIVGMIGLAIHTAWAVAIFLSARWVFQFLEGV